MTQSIRLAAFAALLLGTVSTVSLAQEKQPMPAQPPTAQPPTASSPSTSAAPSAKTQTTPGSTRQAQAHSCATTRQVGQECTCADHPGKAGRVERPSGATAAKCVVPQA